MKQEAELHQRISAILWKDWDPVGLYSEDDQYPNEYDSYVPHILKLAIEGADEYKLSSTLESLLRDNMGGPNDSKCPKTKHDAVAKLIMVAREEIYGQVFDT